MSFDAYIERVLAHEGAYSDDRSDPGNWTGGRVGSGVLKGTKYGIAANTYPNLDIRNLTRDQAVEIYRRDFWEASQADELMVSTVAHGLPARVRSLELLAGAWTAQ